MNNKKSSKTNRPPNKERLGRVSDIDRFTRFLSLFNRFINHRKKPFKKIDGDNFKL